MRQSCRRLGLSIFILLPVVCQSFLALSSLTSTLVNQLALEKAATATRWKNSVVTLPHHDCPATPAVWNQLVPKLWENSRGFDSTRQRACHHGDTQSTRRNMREWVHDSFPATIDATTRETMVAELVASTQAFVDAVQKQGLMARALKARVVASRGAAASKCPQWHIDHVPVRHIQALVGPGCEYVESSYVNWDSINALSDDADELSTEERNRLLVKADTLIHQAPEGQAVLFVGNRWSEFAGYQLDPCVHRSPQALQPWEGRVLLTIDIVDV